MLKAIITDAACGKNLEFDRSCWGFGGVQGGLAVALLLKVALQNSQGLPLRQLHAQFKRPLREAFQLKLDTATQSRSLLWHSVAAWQGEQQALHASALFAKRGAVTAAAPVPAMPAAPEPERCPVFAVPPAFVPFAQYVEIRPVGQNRPFSGAPEAELTAWIRLVEDDSPVDLLTLTVLLDGLAPSYAAMLRIPTAMPTVTFSMTPSFIQNPTQSPWVLLRARTELQVDGWLLENIEAWSPDGTHLASVQQLRMLITQ